MATNNFICDIQTQTHGIQTARLLYIWWFEECRYERDLSEMDGLKQLCILWCAYIRCTKIYILPVDGYGIYCWCWFLLLFFPFSFLFFFRYYSDGWTQFSRRSTVAVNILYWCHFYFFLTFNQIPIPRAPPHLPRQNTNNKKTRIPHQVIYNFLSLSVSSFCMIFIRWIINYSSLIFIKESDDLWM